jgi:hypothetical protein
MITGTNAAARRLVRCIRGTRVYVTTEEFSLMHRTAGISDWLIERRVLAGFSRSNLRADGAVQADLARSYGVSEATISRLAAASPFEHGAVGL